MGVYGSYGINGYVYVLENDLFFGKSALNLWRTPSVKGTGNIPLPIDCYFWSGLPDDDTPPLYEHWQNRSDSDSMNRFCINRYNGSMNCVFLDFAARKMGLKELWTLNWQREYHTNGPWTKAGGVQPQHQPEWMREFKDY